MRPGIETHQRGENLGARRARFGNEQIGQIAGFGPHRVQQAVLRPLDMADMRARSLEARIRASARLVKMQAMPARREHAGLDFQLDQDTARAGAEQSIADRGTRRTDDRCGNRGFGGFGGEGGTNQQSQCRSEEKKDAHE